MSTSPEPRPPEEQPSEVLWDEGLRAAFGADEEQAGSSVLAGLRSSGGASSVHLPALPDAADPVLDAHGEHAPGSRLGRYQVVGEIAVGGVGIVLQGRDTDLGRDVAMKVLRGRYKENRELIRRFVEEAQIGGQLQHPGVVPVYELAVDAHGRPFIAMKLVRGRTLASLLDERRSPADESARFLGIFEKVTQTVAYAHSRGVVHRDLKPSNVMVGTFGEVQLMDWGFAKVLRRGGAADDAGPHTEADQDDPIATVRSQASHRHSLHGSVLGTPAYMPPEQARGEVATLDERCDVFALGAILCEVLTGAPAYTGKQTEETLNRARLGDLDDAYARLDACQAGPEVVALAKACLAREPRERPRNAGVVAEEITRYLGALEERARSAQVAAAESRVRLVAERQSRRLTVALASSVLALLLIAGGAWWWVDRSELRRVERADGAVQAALQEALERAGEGDWGAALAATERAAALHAASPASVPVMQRITELRARFERESKGAVLAARLREIRTSLIDEDELTVDEEYAAAFREFGIDVTALEPDALGVRIRAEPPDLSLAMALALDDWSSRNRSFGRRGGGRRGGGPERTRTSDQTPESAAEPSAERERVDWQKLRDAAIAGDPDPWRVELRRATSVDEPTRLLALADSADLAALDPTRLVLLGRALGMADERERAIEVLQAGFARHRDDYWISVHLAYLYAFAEEPELERAREHAMIAVSLRPDSSRARVLLSRILRSSGEREEAMHVVFEYIRSNPSDWRGRFELGGFMLDVEDAAQDERTVRAILARDPTSSGALDLLARLLDLRCDWQAALDTWTRLIATLPAETAAAGSFGQGYAQRSLGKALEELGRYEEAVAAYRRAAVPGRRERDLQESVQRCERLSALAPRALSDAPLTLGNDELLLAARTCQHAGYFARAAELYARFFASDPEAGPTSFVGQYDAVACAVQAGVGHGPDAPPLASAAAAQSRAQALAWVRANLADQPRALSTPPDGRAPPADGPDPGRRPRDGEPPRSGDPPRGGSPSTWRLARWRHDVRLEGVRDPARLAELPPEEAAEWARVWTELVAELESRRSPPRR